MGYGVERFFAHVQHLEQRAVVWVESCIQFCAELGHEVARDLLLLVGFVFVMDVVEIGVQFEIVAVWRPALVVEHVRRLAFGDQGDELGYW